MSFFSSASAKDGDDHDDYEDGDDQNQDSDQNYFRDGVDGYNTDDMYDDGFGDPVNAQCQAFNVDDFDDVNSAQDLSQDSYYTEEYEEEQAQHTHRESDVTNQNVGFYDSENAKPDIQVAFLDQKVDKSAQNVDQNSITKISSLESTVEPLLPVSSTCVSDGSPEKSSTKIAVEAAGTLVGGQNNLLAQLAPPPAVLDQPAHQNITLGSANHVAILSETLVKPLLADSSSINKNNDGSTLKPLVNPSQPQFDENTSTVRPSSSPQARPTGSFTGAIATEEASRNFRGANNVIDPGKKEKIERNTVGLRRRFEVGNGPQHNGRNSRGIAGFSVDKGLQYQQQQAFFRNRQVPHRDAEHQSTPLNSRNSSSSNSPYSPVLSPVIGVKQNDNEESLSHSSSNTLLGQNSTLQDSMHSSDIHRVDSTVNATHPTSSRPYDSDILPSNQTTSTVPLNKHLSSQKSQPYVSTREKEVPENRVINALNCENYQPSQMSSDHKRPLHNPKDQIIVHEEPSAKRSSIDIGGIFSSDENARVVGGRPPRGPSLSLSVSPRETRGDRVQNAPNLVSNSRGLSMGVESFGRSRSSPSDNRDHKDVEAQIDAIIAKTSKRLREIQQDSGGGGIRTEGNRDEGKENLEETQKVQRLIERDCNIPAFVASLESDSYALARALCRLMVSDAFLLAPKLFQNDQDLDKLR